MRTLATGVVFTVSCVLVVGCRPLSPRSAEPVPEALAAADRVSSSSDASMTRDVRQPTYTSIEELIEGRAPGVQVLRRTDGTFSLRIRGLSSPSSHNDPLIIVDGAALEGRASAALASVNPQDVVRIDVLKDAASTAFYGMRGANGVILITSRHQ
jgi:TonB-dependent SusC/RagA subfamily outer membrane receptor